MPHHRSFAPAVTIVVAAALAALLVACTTGASASLTPSASSGAPSAVSATFRVGGVATAGPVCPVERPGDPACAPRTVAGAILIVTDGSGSEVARVTTGADGRFELSLSAGDYILVPQPFKGLMGTARSIPFSVGATGAPTPAPLQVEYDTGIR